MATLASNRTYWNDTYDWADAGDEWSRPWGGSASQWHATLLPRIRHRLPTNTILEIGCGGGRWTEFLKDMCTRLIVVDLSERCIGACQRRFSRCTHIQYHVNDGMSLAAIAEQSIDFAFSFDSLVHADTAVLEAYLRELSRTLRLGGSAFLHHSNLGEYLALYSWLQGFPTVHRALAKAGIVDGFCHLRDPVVSAAVVRRLAATTDLACVTQETVQWRSSKAMLDCISTFVRTDSPAGTPRLWRNLDFGREVSYARRLHQVYTGTDGPPRLP